MFPQKLDNAEVLFYTAKGDFGTLYDTTEKVFDYAKHLAIGKYPNTSNEYYLFQVNESYEVIGDYLCESIDECMKTAVSLLGSNILWICVG